MIIVMHMYLLKKLYQSQNTTVAGAKANNYNKEVAFKNSAPLTDSISKISNTKIGNAKDTDVLMLMYLDKYQSKITTQVAKQFLDYLIDPSF